jgi:uncharacterized protein (TIGR00369 family)
MPHDSDRPDRSDAPDYVKVCTVNGENEANVLRSALEAAGIPVELTYEALATVLPVAVDGLGAVNVMVPEDCLEDAREIARTPAEPIGSISELELRDDRMCFACGKDNADGLRLEFTFGDNEVETTFSFPKKYQGYRDVVHGGLLSTVLDEVMVTLVNRLGRLAVTAELNVRFLNPLEVETEFTATAWLEETRGRVHRVAASAVLLDGTEVARATSRCIDMGPIPGGWATRGDAGSPPGDTTDSTGGDAR